VYLEPPQYRKLRRCDARPTADSPIQEVYSLAKRLAQPHHQTYKAMVVHDARKAHARGT